MENQRTRLSKRLLKDALIDLLQEKPLSKISIKSICEKAEINRTTFYKYYQTERDLLVEIERENIEYIKAIVTEKPDALETILQFLKDNPKTAKALTSDYANINFIQKICELAEIEQSFKVLTRENTKYAEKRYEFIIMGSYALIKKWIANDFDITPKELSALLREMISKILR